jgi:hypothetical protein
MTKSDYAIMIIFGVIVTLAALNIDKLMVI